jgi:hypothetical protein
MARFPRRPSNMPSMRGGRMWNRFTGSYAPRHYSGGRYRPAHRTFGTQPTGYGAAMGGYGQIHSAMSGSSGNVYRHALNMARRGGMNLGHRAPATAFHTRRVDPKFRYDLAKANRFRFEKREGESRRDARSRRRSERQEWRSGRSARKREVALRYRQKWGGGPAYRQTTIRDPHGPTRRFFGGWNRGRNQDLLERKYKEGFNRHKRWRQFNDPRWDAKKEKMPSLRNLRNRSLGGYRYMSDRGAERLRGLGQEQAGIRSQQEDFRKSLAERKRRHREKQLRKRQQDIQAERSRNFDKMIPPIQKTIPHRQMSPVERPRRRTGARELSFNAPWNPFR